MFDHSEVTVDTEGFLERLGNGGLATGRRGVPAPAFSCTRECHSEARADFAAVSWLRETLTATDMVWRLDPLKTPLSGGTS